MKQNTYNLETLNSDLVDSNTSYVKKLFNEEDLWIDVSNSEMISVVHHTFQTISFDLCKRVANHIRKNLDYTKTIFVGAYIFEFSKKTN